MVPPVAVQVTAVFDRACDGCGELLRSAGKECHVERRDRDTHRRNGDGDTGRRPDLVESCTLVALTLNEPVVVPAVNRPAVVMVPPVAVQVTAVLECR